MAVTDHLRLHFAGQPYESFVDMFLDARPIAIGDLFRGAIAQTSVYSREVVRRSIATNAAAVVLSHNHPSGVAELSRADQHLMQCLKQALALVDVRVLDHIVIAGSQAVSLAQQGLLEQPPLLSGSRRTVCDRSCRRGRSDHEKVLCV